MVGVDNADSIIRVSGLEKSIENPCEATDSGQRRHGGVERGGAPCCGAPMRRTHNLFVLDLCAPDAEEQLLGIAPHRLLGARQMPVDMDLIIRTIVMLSLIHISEPTRPY